MPWGVSWRYKPGHERYGVDSMDESKPSRQRIFHILVVLLALLLVASCFFIPYVLTRKGSPASNSKATAASDQQEIEELEKVLSSSNSYNEAQKIVENNYVDPVNGDELLEAGAKGIRRMSEEGADKETLDDRGIVAMMNSLYDPFSAFMTPQEVQALDSQLSGHISGIGAVMQSVKNEVRVFKTLDGSPAQEAGLKEGDIVREVDGKDVTDMALTEVVDLIRGPQGTTVRLGIMRAGSPDLIFFDIVRKDIEIPVVQHELREGNVGYLSISDWSENVDEKISEALEDLRAQGAKSLVVDLRANGGGYMEPAVAAADLFLPGGTIVSSKGRIPGTTREYKADGDVQWDGPVVLLVDRGSASSSEIFASALHDNNRCTLVGETTFGKGSVQKLYRQGDGSAVRLTVARYYTPSGASINDEGIAPDILVRNPVTGGQDLQLEKALEVASAQ